MWSPGTDLENNKSDSKKKKELNKFMGNITTDIH